MGTRLLETSSRFPGILCACCKHNESVDIGEKLDSMHFELLTSATNRAFSVLHACGLPTTPPPMACGDVTAHARSQCHKKEHLHVVQPSVALLRYTGSRACGVSVLESSSQTRVV